MCKGKKECIYIPSDIEEWSSYSTLEPPSWFKDEFKKFTEAVTLFYAGKKEECIKTINSIKNEEMQEWYINHAQVSGTIKKNITAIKRPPTIEEKDRDPKRMPSKKEEKQILKRDGYKCRYCQNPILDKGFVKKFIEDLNLDSFKKGSTNDTTHGILLNFSPVIDHVIPHNIGGKTEEANLVTSCYPCNFGKQHYTLEQVKNISPFEREPILDDWDGMQHFIKK